MASAAVARSPTTERLYSLYHKKNIIRISLKPKNFGQSTWKPKNNSHTSRESRNSTHTEPHTSGQPRSYFVTLLESTDSPHTSREPKNSDQPPWESHTSENPGSSTLTPWEPRNFTSTPGQPRSVPDLNPLNPPTEESDQQKEDSASIPEIRHSSARRNSLENIHQEKNADQTLEARLDVMFGKDKNNNYINESLGIPPTAKAKGLGKKRKYSAGKHVYQKCYTCGDNVKDVHFEKHLFFGETECTKCSWKISSCEAFREYTIDLIMGNSTCQHTLTYCMTPSEYISNKMSQESLVDLNRSEITLYVRSLNRLKGFDPWKKAIDQCLSFLDGETSRPSETNEERSNALETKESVPTGKYEMNNSPWPNDLILSQPYDLDHLNDVVKIEIATDYPEARMERSPVLFTESDAEHMSTSSLPHRQMDIDTCSGNLVRDVASQSTSLSNMTGMVGNTNSTRLQKGPLKKKRKRAKRSKSKSGFSRLQANTDAEKSFIETPANGYYLIVRHAIEECPMCYTKLCPTRFTVNIYTYLLTTVCTGCDLTIYIIFDPPDGSAPRISIETESSPPEKKKKRVERRKHKGHEGRSRVKDFFKG